LRRKGRTPRTDNLLPLPRAGEGGGEDATVAPD
jgi:hypothetical protein